MAKTKRHPNKKYLNLPITQPKEGGKGIPPTAKAVGILPTILWKDTAQGINIYN